MIRTALAIGMVAAAFTASAASAAPRGHYILEQQMEASLQEHGLAWNHRTHAVLSAACDGQGFAGPKQTDEWGFKEASYRQFLCIVTVRGARDLTMIHVTMRPGDHWAWEEI